ncbi:MAG TPA: L-2-hydroxyglutarate oxidase [Lacipirellulaceae bacterium]|nr:L-2-hydroxyglutarate oxidase [Lacipirellulaceae bacterium]
MEHSDLIIIGGGIVGLATAYRFLERFPGKRVTVLEKEPTIARHQTGRNAGVLHSGIYYRPGSLKAQNCRAGKLAMEEFCRREGIPFKICGKVIVALEESELPRMEKILENGKANGVVCERIDTARLKELEPHAAGIAAIHVPESGIVDYQHVARRLAELIEVQGSRIKTGARVTAVSRHQKLALVETTAGEFPAEQVVNCAGLHSDRVTRLSGAKPSSKIIPFRGEFYLVRPEAHHLVRMLIYPVPDPRYPFLGVHFTRRIDGRVECGPNAVLAFAREGYRNTTVNLRDMAETLGYRGFWRLSARYWRIGADEMRRSFSKRAFVRAAQRLVPEIEPEHFEWAPAGVRAQAVAPDGSMVDDFVISETDRVVNVENAPSPAATASLNIGRLVVERLAPRFE